MENIDITPVTLARAGFRVFPLRPNTKFPAVKDWPAFASNDVEIAGQHFANRFKDYNVAVATGKGVLVLDFDCKENRPGLQSLEMLDCQGLPQSIRATTPSGGVHVYLAAPPDIGISISVDAIPDYPGLDIRCEGGYVVAPPSTLDGRPYAFQPGSHTIEPAPQWLLDILRQHASKRRERTDDAPTIELDQDRSVARAIDYLTHHAPEAVEGAGGDHATYETICRVRDFGISETQAFELVAIHWNEAGKASPPWDAADLMEKVSNAYLYATGRPGQIAGLAEFEPVPLYEPVKRGIYRVPFDTAAGLALEQTGDPLIEGLLDQQTMAILYGASNTGKTFLALDLAYHIATGQPWQGRETARGLVVYVAAEGGRGIYKRIAALKQRYGGANVPLDLVPCSVNLLSSKADIDALIALVRDAEKAHGAPARLLVVDTLSRALAGGDENTSTDMGAYVKNADKIRDAIKATMLNVHHSGKDVARGARGWSGLRAATDTEIEIIEGAIDVTKQRDLEPIRPAMKFALDTVTVGSDQKGRPVTSCVLRIVTGTEFMQIELDGAASDMLDAFDDVIEDAGDPDRVVTAEEWDAQYRENVSGNIVERGLSYGTSASETTTRYLRMLRKKVEESGYIQKIKRGQWVRVVAEVTEVERK